LTLALAGCDQSPASSRHSVQLPKRTVIQVESVTQLAPNRIAHVALDRAGHIYFTVETTEGSDGVIVVNESGLPRATRLTSANIPAALGETIGGSGTIQDLVSGSDGAIYFYFSGGKGRAIRACLGRFVPQNETINILIDSARLAKFS